MKFKQYLICWLIFASLGILEAAEVEDGDIEACRRIEVRLERLACFDQLFSVPMQIEDAYGVSLKTQSWLTIAATAITSKSGMVVRANTSGREHTWPFYSASAVNTRPENTTSTYLYLPPTLLAQHPTWVLQVSCDADITQLSLLALEVLRFFPVVKITLPGGIEIPMTVEEGGRVARTGRGLESIRAIRTIYQRRVSGMAELVIQSGGETYKQQYDMRTITPFLAEIGSLCHWRNPIKG